MAEEESEYVTLVSCDGFEFVMKRSAAVISDTIKRMLNPRSMCAVLYRLYQDATADSKLCRSIPGSIVESMHVWRNQVCLYSRPSLEVTLNVRPKLTFS